MKMTYQPLPQGFLILALVLAIMMVRAGEAALCSDGVPAGGACDATPPEGACYKDCVRRHPGGQAACEQNLCKCFFECPSPPTKKCNVGLGRCSASCSDQCCNSNCASAHAGGVGYCDDSLGKPNSLCQCQYPC